MSGKKLAERLDWNAMLGFEQVVDSRESLGPDGSERLGAKVGGKPGVKPVDTIGTKTGSKPVMIGTKTGTKPIGNTIGAKTGVKPVA